MRQVMCALEFLHLRGISHCDVKLENVLLSNLSADFSQAKLCDFGFARFIENEVKIKNVGSYEYMAPELRNNTGKFINFNNVKIKLYKMFRV